MQDKLKQLRLLAFGNADEKEQDELLNYCYNYAHNKVLAYLTLMQEEKGLVITKNIPKSLEWLVIEVAIRRFNRQGSEGFRSQSVEGQTITFTEDSDFISSEIQKYLNTRNHNLGKGRIYIY